MQDLKEKFSELKFLGLKLRFCIAIGLISSRTFLVGKVIPSIYQNILFNHSDIHTSILIPYTSNLAHNIFHSFPNKSKLI